VDSPPESGRAETDGAIPMAENKLGAAAQRVGEDGREFYERAKEQANAAFDAGREGFDAAVEEGKRQVDSVSGMIRDWPLLSVGVAFVAGCLVSRLMSGRR